MSLLTVTPVLRIVSLAPEPREHHEIAAALAKLCGARRRKTANPAKKSAYQLRIESRTQLGALAFWHDPSHPHDSLGDIAPMDDQVRDLNWAYPMGKGLAISLSIFAVWALVKAWLAAIEATWLATAIIPGWACRRSGTHFRRHLKQRGIVYDYSGIRFRPAAFSMGIPFRHGGCRDNVGTGRRAATVTTRQVL
jgi:hypothetical protein